MGVFNVRRCKKSGAKSNVIYFYPLLKKSGAKSNVIYFYPINFLKKVEQNRMLSTFHNAVVVNKIAFHDLAKKI